MILFYSFKDWKRYIISAVRKLCVSLLRIVWGIINGIASLVAGVLRSVCAFTDREPKLQNPNAVFPCKHEKRDFLPMRGKKHNRTHARMKRKNKARIRARKAA